MDGILALTGLIVVMFSGSFLSGLLPLAVTFSEFSLVFLSTSRALMFIISHWLLIILTVSPLKSNDKLKKVTVFGAGLLVGTALAVIIPEGVKSLIIENAPNPVNNPTDTNATHVDGRNEALSAIGYCLVLGFVFMLLVDQLSQRRNSGLNSTESHTTATIGLVVHAAADGVALGAAASTSHADVEIIVFLAIMLHKAPAAFGLVTFLLHEGLERRRIQKHLFIFSLAAPLLTIITYIFIGQKGKETLNSINATGIAMLFSAGTFLYVATVHVLADLTHTPPNYSRLQNLESGVKNVQPQRLNFGEILYLVLGCLAPLFLTVVHHH